MRIYDLIFCLFATYAHRCSVQKLCDGSSSKTILPPCYNLHGLNRLIAGLLLAHLDKRPSCSPLYNASIASGSGTLDNFFISGTSSLIRRCDSSKSVPCWNWASILFLKSMAWLLMTVLMLKHRKPKPTISCSRRAESPAIDIRSSIPSA